MCAISAPNALKERQAANKVKEAETPEKYMPLHQALNMTTHHHQGRRGKTANHLLKMRVLLTILRGMNNNKMRH
jgi:hypothetical protein